MGRMAGLWASVLSMMTEKERMYAVSELGKIECGLSATYLTAKDSISRSIFWASPGNRNSARNTRNASSKLSPGPHPPVLGES